MRYNKKTRILYMQLKKLYISGFKSISNDTPQTIYLEHEITTFIGHNGAGKSAAMEALNKLFSIDHSLRGLTTNDFHISNDNMDKDKNLVIEAWFTFPNYKESGISIPPLIENLTIEETGGNLFFRVRLEGLLSFEYNPLGDIDENIWIVTNDKDEPSEADKIKLSAALRNSIQVSYVPANRDPLAQLKYSSRAVLGRLLKAIKWTNKDKDNFEKQAISLNQLAKNNPALTEISEAINKSWGSIYKGRYLSEASLNFPLTNIDEILKLLQLQFNPDESGNAIDTSRLSDGQKSLVYFALTKALFDIDKNTRNAVYSGNTANFDPDIMRLPIFSLIALEEPENLLSPHYLGRIIGLINDYGKSELCQAIISSHSASIVGRIEPEQIRHFRLDHKSQSTIIAPLDLPSRSDDRTKFISEAVKAYPEIYFSKLVILGEGDSEQVLIPKMLEHFSTDIDAHSISVVPLGGKHVNHYWRLLDSIKIPYITLLDFDIDRNGGGFGRVKYAIEQLSEYKSVKYLHKGIVSAIPGWDDPKNPIDFNMDFSEEDHSTSKINLVNELEKHKVFFSAPLDIDYAMIEAFPEIFCVKDEFYGERGPNEGKEDEEDSNVKKREEALIKAVLKKGNKGIRFNFSEDCLINFLWYRYRFLSNKSKPASHVRLFAKLEKQFSSDQIRSKLPPELQRMLSATIEMFEEIIE